MTDETTPKKKAKASAAPVGIWKPKGEEFALAVEFQAIADDLGLDVDAVEFALADETRDGIDGQTLTGAPK